MRPHQQGQFLGLLRGSRRVPPDDHGPVRELQGHLGGGGSAHDGDPPGDPRRQLVRLRLRGARSQAPLQADGALRDGVPSRVDKDIRFEHKGEEFRFEATIEGRNKIWILSLGDGAYFDSEIPHRGRSLRGESRALVVIYRSKDPA